MPDKQILVAGTELTQVYDDEGNPTSNHGSLFVLELNSNGFSDSSFGTNGIVRIDFGENKNVGSPEMIVQADGKIMLAATSTGDIVRIRLNSNGTIDSTFGENGISITDINKADDGLKCMLLLENQKTIIFAGFGAIDSTAVLRYNSNGTVDSSFGINGKVILAHPGAGLGSAAALLPNGKIAISGYNYQDSSFLLAAINRNGSLDSSFGSNGFTTTSFKSVAGSSRHEELAMPYDIAIGPDGSIVLAGIYQYESSFYDEQFKEIALAKYHGETVLPITLSSFTATKKQSSIVLNWQTANETNNSHFSLERSNNNNDSFKEIARVNSKGNSSQTQQYSYEDITPLKGNNYYRLKQSDKDGSVTTSKIILVDFSNNNVRIYPNPAFAVLNIEGLKQGSKTNLSILNSNGVIIATANTDNFNYSFHIRTLPAGTYFLKIKNDENEMIKQFIKQ